MNTCIIIMCSLSPSIALFCHRTHSLLLMGNVRTRTTACFPIIAINGSIHVCTSTERKSYNDKMGYFDSIQQQFSSASERPNKWFHKQQHRKKRRRRRNEVCCFQVIASLRLHYAKVFRKQFVILHLKWRSVCLVALDTFSPLPSSFFFSSLVCEKSNKIFHFL